MTRGLARALGGAVAALALLASPAAAQVLVAPPYDLTINLGALAASPAAGGTTLALQAQGTPGGGVVFTPAAASAPAGCTTVLVANTTTCLASTLTTGLHLDGTVLEVGVHGVTTPEATFTGTTGNDAIAVDGSIGTVTMATGSGDNSVTVGGAVGALHVTSPNAGNDRYVIDAPATTITGRLELGAGSDVASSNAPNLVLAGGAGNDTLSGAGALMGDGGDDLLKPSVAGTTIDGGLGGLDHLSFELAPTGLTLTKSGTNVVRQGDGVVKAGIEVLEGSRRNDTIIGGGTSDVLLGGEGDDTIEGGGGTDDLDGGPGINTVSYEHGPSPVTVDLAAGTATTTSIDQLRNFRRVVTGPGDDIVTGTTADEQFVLGAGNDTVNAGPGNDAVDAGPGDDLVRGGHGTDVVDGGPGTDTATYDERTASEPVSVTLLTPGDDGAPGENDTLAGVEDVVGGASSDVLIGDDGPNLLVGGGGLNTLSGAGGNDVLVGGDFRDVITGGPGSDQLIGNGDDDSLDAFDGEPDLVDCGPSLDDDAQVDASDQVSGCEFSRRGDVPVPVDGDGDGTVAGFDCDDTNPAIGLTAVDIPGDGIDQNCDGFDEPLALVAGLIGYGFDPPTRHGTRITRLVLTRLQGDSTVVVTCRTPIKRRCPFTRATRRPTTAGGQLSLTKLLRHRVLPVGTTVEVRITAPGVLGRVRRFTVRASAALRATDLCLQPSSSVAKKCPPDVL